MNTSVQFGNYSPRTAPESTDFDITLSLGQVKTFVPMGILNFDNGYENPYFNFNYTLSGAPLETLNFRILAEDGSMLYDMTYIEAIIVTASKKSVLEARAKKEVPLFNFENPVRSWNYNSIFKEFNLTEPDYTLPGSYGLMWDGFDNDEVFDSRNFSGKKLKAIITGVKAGKQKTKEIEFFTNNEVVNWTDVKINRKAKRIDVELRVNLKDGGASGFETVTYRDPLDDPRGPAVRSRKKWQSIPASEIGRIGRSPFQAATRSYDQLKQLAINGLNYHWGRNQNHGFGKFVNISGVSYQVYMNAVNVDDDAKAIDDIELMYNTNGDSMRSGNPGTVQDVVSLVGNLISREAICYNVGYIKYSNGWGYASEDHADNEFRDTSAHEIGHTILKAYGGTGYSYGHKGSTWVVTQSIKSSAPQIPLAGEIDIMPYFNDNVLGNEHFQKNYYTRRVAAERDVLSLLWLTKLKIQ